MKKLTCEMCGSTDLIKQDGVFVCQACGCKYTVEEAKKMMVEGTVDVSGSTVKVDNSELIKNYLEMANSAYSAGNKVEAEQYCNKVIEINPTHYQAWFLKGKASGWQSTLQNIRFSESVSSFSKALLNAPVEEKQRVISDSKKEIHSLAKALVSLRTNRFEKWPNEDEAKGFCTDLQCIYQTIIQFIVQLGDFEGFSLLEFMTPIFKIITDCVSKTWNNVIVPEYSNANNGYPDKFALTKMLDRAGNCEIVLDKVISLSDKEDEDIIKRYDLLIRINEYCIQGKAYRLHTWTDYEETWTGTKYFTKSKQVLDCSLSGAAVAERREKINKCISQKAAVEKNIKKKKGALIQKRKEEYWEGHKEQRKELVANLNMAKTEKKKNTEALEKCKNDISEIKHQRDCLSPSEKKEKEISEKIKLTENTISTLSIFKRKEKEALKKQLLVLSAEHQEITCKAKEERATLETSLSERENKLKTELKKLEKIITECDDKINSIMAELNKER